MMQCLGKETYAQYPRGIDARRSSCRPPETDAATTALHLQQGLWGLDLTSTLAPRLAASGQPTGVQCIPCPLAITKTPARTRSLYNVELSGPAG
jgi:hypothetical protein